MDNIHISKMTGKLLGIPAINTDTTSNPFCIRQKNTDTICGECYSWEMLQTYRKNCIPPFKRNSELLSNVIPFDNLPVLNYAYLRHDGHGELQNYSHLVNIHNLAVKNPAVTFTLWTKRATLVRQYHREYSQPDNLILIFSNPTIDKVIGVPRGFNKVFNNVAPDSPVEQNCTGQKCLQCLKCYRKDSGADIIVEAVK